MLLSWIKASSRSIGLTIFSILPGFVWAVDFQKAPFFPGMEFENISIPLSSKDEKGLDVLFAKRAEVLNPPQFLCLYDLNSSLTVDEFSRDRPSISVKRAIFDFNKKEIVSLYGTIINLTATEQGIGVKNSNINTNRRGAESNATGDYFEKIINSGILTEGSLFIRVNLPNALICAERKRFFGPSNSEINIAKKDYLNFVSMELSSRLKIVRDACQTIGDFYKCFPLVDGSSVRHMGFFSKNGGRLASLENGVFLNGPAVALSESFVLSGFDGISLRRERVEDHDVMETGFSASNGVKAVISCDNEPVEIECQSFKYIAERRVSQFEGGPIVIRRNQVILAAAEPWQFVRIFDHRRIVLSPGQWNMIGKCDTEAENTPW